MCAAQNRGRADVAAPRRRGWGCTRTDISSLESHIQGHFDEVKVSWEQLGALCRCRV